MSTARARTGSADVPLVEGEFAFTRDDFNKIADLLYADAGITLSDSKSTLVYSRLAKRVRALGLNSFAAYYEIVSDPSGDAERKRMLNALTTNLTRFFREPHHFDHLRDKVLAPIADRVRAGGRLRLWSCGCSSGQEPYSIALTVLSVIPNAAELDVKILATDIDTNMVAQGQAGVYTEDLIEPIPSALRNRWLVRDSDRADHWRIAAAPRSLVSFKPLNLMGSWPLRGPFQAIFCRNVAIYFDEPTQETVWSRFAPLLEPGGRLYIGHSERLAGAASLYLADGLTTYRTPPRSVA